MRRRGPRKTGYWSRSRADQKFHVLPDWLFVAEVVILLEQAVEQRLLRRTPHGAELQRRQCTQRHHERSGVDLQGRRFLSPGLVSSRGVETELPRRRQRDVSSPVETQQQPAADHVARRPVDLLPSPGLTQEQGKPPASGTRMRGNQLADEPYLLASPTSTAVELISCKKPGSFWRKVLFS